MNPAMLRAASLGVCSLGCYNGVVLNRYSVAAKEGLVIDRQLKSPPLVEALLEVRWRLSEDRLPIDRAYPLIVGLFYGEVKDSFPVKEELMPQSQFPTEVLQYTVTHRFRVGENEWPLVQIGPGIASLNYDSSYNWDRFKTDANDLFSRLRVSYNTAANADPVLEQVTLRFINVVHIEDDDGGMLEFLRDKLHIEFAPMPPNSSLPDSTCELAGFRFQTAYSLTSPAGGAMMTVSTGWGGDPLAVVFDLNVISAEQHAPVLNEFSAWLSQAHTLIEDWFFALIDGELHVRFEKE